MSTDELILKVGVLKVISEFTKDRYNEARAEADAVMSRGDRLIARSPIDGMKIGPVIKTDPKPVARVTDEHALTSWMVENYPEKTQAAYEVTASHAELVAVLFDHAPQFLKRRKQIKSADLAELKRDAVSLGHPVGPSGEADVPGLVVEIPEPVVSCKPDEDSALLAVMTLHGAGLLSLDGTVLPALPSSEAPRES